MVNVVKQLKVTNLVLDTPVLSIRKVFDQKDAEIVVSALSREFLESYHGQHGDTLRHTVAKNHSTLVKLVLESSGLDPAALVRTELTTYIPAPVQVPAVVELLKAEPRAEF